MNRKLYALLPWMALAGAAAAQSRPADVLYTFREATPVRGFRLGDECFVPLDAARYWGWSADRDGDAAKLTAEGSTVRVPLRVVNGQPSLALRRAITLLGGDSEWIATTDSLRVFSPLSSLAFVDGRVVARAPLAVRTTGFALSDPNRAVVDLEGARLPARLDLPPNVRATQYRPNVVRVVVETPYVPESLGMGGLVGRDVSVDVRSANLPVGQTPILPTNPPGFDPLPPIEPVVRGSSLAIDVLADTDARTTLRIPLAGRIKGPATYAKPDPLTLEITLPFVGGSLPDGFISPTLAVSGFSAVRRGFDTILTIRYARPLGAEVVSGPDGVLIDLVPSDPASPLAGKVVIVDPGHGGHDSGAKGGGVREKDLALAVSNLLTAELMRAGATVLMTRRTDVFIPLQIRSDISNRTHADLFIAVHINSTGGSGSQSGTISFHHLKNPVGQRMAACIQREMAKVNGLPNKGVWSDGRIYESGFAVLRNTRQRAAVLLELGFINHPTDRGRMVTKDFQTKVAAAIVRGVRTFLGEPTLGAEQ